MFAYLRHAWFRLCNHFSTELKSLTGLDFNDLEAILSTTAVVLFSKLGANDVFTSSVSHPYLVKVSLGFAPYQVHTKSIPSPYQVHTWSIPWSIPSQGKRCFYLFRHQVALRLRSAPVQSAICCHLLHTRRKNFALPPPLITTSSHLQII